MMMPVPMPLMRFCDGASANSSSGAAPATVRSLWMLTTAFLTFLTTSTTLERRGLSEARPAEDARRETENVTRRSSPAARRTVPWCFGARPFSLIPWRGCSLMSGLGFGVAGARQGRKPAVSTPFDQAAPDSARRWELGKACWGIRGARTPVASGVATAARRRPAPSAPVVPVLPAPREQRKTSREPERRATMSGPSRRERLEAMLRDNPNDPFLRYGLAMEHVSLGDDEGAMHYFRELLAGTPTYVPAYLQVGQALNRLGRIPEAAEVLRKGIAVARQQNDLHAAGEMEGLLNMVECKGSRMDLDRPIRRSARKGAKAQRRTPNALCVFLCAFAPLRALLCLVLLVLASSVQADPPGVDKERLQRIDTVVREAIDRGELPGAVVLVLHKGEVIHRKEYGLRSKKPAETPMTEDTVFDLASLTKPIATATSIMMLIEQGKLRPSDKVSEHLPDFAANGKESITVEQLLTHTSGLLADNPVTDYLDGHDKALERIYQLNLTAEPGTRFIYSDVNFIVLGELVGKLAGIPLDEFSAKNVFVPLGMKETGFRPGDKLKERAAPTEARDGRFQPGVVHDPRSFHLGGVAGHAGLFSTAGDLALYAR